MSPSACSPRVVALQLLTLRRLRRVEARQLGAAPALRLTTVNRRQRAAELLCGHFVSGSRRSPAGNVEGAGR
ncbi:hypothetical protein [Sorangium sp. So ce1000]|uniref:hypothetical protein n=1 Tax=Sorangium sp. So ce1000 TaxID=3133325 RepID=UPI003F5F6FDF